MLEIEIEVNKILIKNLQEKIKRFKKLDSRMSRSMISKYNRVILDLKKEMED